MADESENELEKLLENTIDEQYGKNTDNKETQPTKCPFYHRNATQGTKTTKINKIEEKTKFNKKLLPEGWVRIYHESGMFFYCHVATRVVTWSMPYQLQMEPARHHRVPVRSIPCLSFLLLKNNGACWDELSKTKTQETVQQSVDSTDNSLDKLENHVVSRVDEIKENDEEEAEREDGEIDSSDEDAVEKDKELPKRYRIKPGQINSELKNQKRHKSESECFESKRPKISAEEVSKENNTISSPKPTETPTVEDSPIDYSAKLLNPNQFRNYCDKLFTFVDEVQYMSNFFFKRKKKNNAQGNSNNQQIAPNQIDPKANCEITSVPINCKTKLKVPNKDLLIDIAGRNFNCVLNMYCQHAFGVTPSFKNVVSKSGIHDFEITCEINGTAYATGEGRTKKVAKQRAVLKTLEILVPGFYNKITDAAGDNFSSGQFLTSNDAGDKLYEIFDSMDITDPRVYSYSLELNIMTPYDVFMECMNRHCVSDSQIISKIEKQSKHILFKLKVGDKEVEVICENKREGRQLASQYMLAKLHAHIQCWGGIMRLYGPGSNPVKRFDMHEMQNLLLEDRGGIKNNLIKLLRLKMLDLNDEWTTSSKSKAKFKTPFENIPIIVFHPDSTKPDGS